MEGFVHCDCHRKGLASPHPVQGRFRESEFGLFVLDGNPTEAELSAHDEWLDSACSHDLMMDAYAFLYGLDQVSLLEYVFSDEGPGGPLHGLKSILLSEADPPSTPGTSIPPLAEELATLESRLQSVPHCRVLDMDLGSVLAEGAGHPLYAYTGDGHRLDYSPRGLALHRGENRIFETMELEQKDLGNGTYRLVAEDGTEAIVSAAFIAYDAENPAAPQWPFPRRVGVESSPLDPMTLEPCTDGLKALFEAGSRLGHPIIWCGNQSLLI